MTTSQEIASERVPATAIVRRVQDLLREHYPIRETVAPLVASLADLGPLPAEPGDLADLLTDRLRHASGDGHLSVRHRPEGVASELDPTAYLALYEQEATENAGGVRSVLRTADGTGVLEIAPYLSPVHLAAPYVEAAFALLEGVERLVIDVRDGRGGTPETVALICSHLLGVEPVHLHTLVSGAGATRQSWTSPTARRLSCPVAVLTSSGTFSGCEQLAYDLQALGRAVVVGESTGGGAHPVEEFRLTEHLQARIPTSRPVNAVTGSNWEGTGVSPDVPCPAPEAMALALAALADG